MIDFKKIANDIQNRVEDEPYVFIGLPEQSMYLPELLALSSGLSLFDCSCHQKYNVDSDYTKEQKIVIADYQIQLWQEFKEAQK